MSVYYYFYNNERQTFLIANNNNNKHLKNLEDSFAVNILELNYTDILYLWQWLRGLLAFGKGGVKMLDHPHKEELSHQLLFWFVCLFVFIYLAAPGLSCSMRDLVPWPGIEPGPPALEVWSLNHWTTREVPNCCFLLGVYAQGAEMHTFDIILWYCAEIPFSFHNVH